jgi:hypothetical protein
MNRQLEAGPLPPLSSSPSDPTYAQSYPAFSLIKRPLFQPLYPLVIAGVSGVVQYYVPWLHKVLISQPSLTSAFVALEDRVGMSVRKVPSIQILQLLITEFKSYSIYCSLLTSNHIRSIVHCWLQILFNVIYLMEVPSKWHIWYLFVVASCTDPV